MDIVHDNFSIIPILIAGIITLAALFSVPHMIQVFYGQKAPPVNPSIFTNNGIANPSVAQTPLNTQGLLISQSTAYKDSTGVIHIVGEIQNVLPFPVSFVKVTATILGSGMSSSYADIDQLRPGEKSGFQVALNTPMTGGKQYQLSTSYIQASTPKSPSLNLILGKPYTDSSGQYHIVGEIINQGQQVANAVKVSTVFYDTKGKLVDESFSYTLPTDLAPGMSAPFDIKPLSSNLAHKAKFASTNVQSEQFSSFNYNPSVTPYQQQQLLTLGGYSLYTVAPGEEYLLSSNGCYNQNDCGGKDCVNGQCQTAGGQNNKHATGTNNNGKCEMVNQACSISTDESETGFVCDRSSDICLKTNGGSCTDPSQCESSSCQGGVCTVGATNALISTGHTDTSCGSPPVACSNGEKCKADSSGVYSCQQPTAQNTDTSCGSPPVACSNGEKCKADSSGVYSCQQPVSKAEATNAVVSGGQTCPNGEQPNANGKCLSVKQSKTCPDNQSPDANGNCSSTTGITKK